jgi:hypothetical protein
MQRNPDDRYPSAAAMKAELDAPEKVVVTGRHERLQAPEVSDSFWQQHQVLLLSLIVPVVIVGLFFLLVYRFRGR